MKKRKDNEPLFAISKMGMHFNHLGIQTKDIKQNESHPLAPLLTKERG